jgi:hypothetical protein
MNPPPASATLAETIVVPAVTRAPSAAILTLCAGLSFTAALIHVEAAIDHLAEYAAYVPAFLLLAAAQTVLAIRLVGEPSRRCLRAGLLLGVGVILIWAASRTTGIPIAPTPWARETVGPADAAVTLDEIATVLAIGLVLATAQHPGRWPRWGRHVAPFLGVILCVTLLLAVAGGHAG